MNVLGSSEFYVIGLSYKKADAEVRGHFSVSEEAQEQILSNAKASGVEALTVISTCNRTELYGFAQNPSQLIQLLCKYTQGNVEEFEKVSYIHESDDAIQHLFKVGTGLDSQILGDFEIIGQLKVGFKKAKTHDLVNPFMERLINSVIQASKRIKTETEISSGATSVSFAAVQYIMARVPYVSEKNILLFGTGKIGRNTCENLIKHTKNEHITLINRTKEKAQKIAGKFNLLVKDYADIQSEISQTDVLVVATGAQNPTITKELIYTKKPLLILDLSIPKNVASNVTDLENVTLIHLDQLSKMTDDTLKRRQQYIPKAEAIIAQITKEFKAWLSTRAFAPTIQALKSKLNDISALELNNHRKKIDSFNEDQAHLISDRLIQKITNRFANHLRNANGTTEQSIELIKAIFELEQSDSE
ncbi:glutamyl-tRNA reductase [Dokdonia pacifica]|uniref:Glutamyl-tRNA reductase n=1 Tax=Dokdonia pacifica TaxID=1627892 RepID=A0A238WC93_9FLAO|nr:glutamyl-tRNA reductase [Dokdonia pacifica]GGG13305.1 glutamyl-tRNA reductase [Dokdonia pacifica]SNR43873.1 glutamyl-tRNA reductase [Dokdonia pacifica]